MFIESSAEPVESASASWILEPTGGFADYQEG